MAKTAKIRLFIDAQISAGVAIALDKEQSHYVANVMRAKARDDVAIFNGVDGGWLASFESVNKRAVVLVPKKQIAAQPSEPDLWLVFAPIKKGRLDYMVQKATEMGVSELLPVRTERTQVERLKHERLVANAVEAAEQCERFTVPKVHEYKSLKEVIVDWPEDRQILFCDEGRAGVKITLKADADVTNKPWAIFIGPEGGFSEAERELLTNIPQTQVLSLGPRILRADTAAIAALTYWQLSFGDW